MKFFALVTFSMISLSTFAAEEQFAKNKEMVLANIDKRISLIQEHRGCVAGAADKNALKVCHDKHKTDMKSLHSANKGIREQFKSERKAKKAAKSKT
jgi:hypothetical protein